MKLGRSRRAHNVNKRLVGGQYLPQTHRYQTVLALCIFFLLEMTLLYLNKDSELSKSSVEYAAEHFSVRAMEATPSAQLATPSAKVEKTSTYTEIEADIRAVFGEHAEKALKVLSCENASLNPKAVNHNKDAAHSTDYGVFQINDHWQGVSNTHFLTDPSINVRMAWNIYKRDGYSFKLWTCGRKLGL